MVPHAPSQESEKKPPSQSFLKRVEGMTIDAVSKALDIPKKPEDERVAKLTAAQEEQLRKIESHAIRKFEGDLTQLEAALGMLRLGHHVGWKVLYLIHTKKTIRTYEEILGEDVKIRELFKDVGPSSYRSIGLNLADRFTNFWKVVGGAIKIPRKRDVAR